MYKIVIQKTNHLIVREINFNKKFISILDKCTSMINKTRLSYKYYM